MSSDEDIGEDDAYLLNAKYSRTPRKVQIRDRIVFQYAWTFHPPILRVSHQLHEESREILGENAFVVIERVSGTLERDHTAAGPEHTDGVMSLWPGKTRIKQASVPGEQMRVQFARPGKSEDPELCVLLLSELRSFCIALSSITHNVSKLPLLTGMNAKVTIKAPKHNETPEAKKAREEALLKPLSKLRYLNAVSIDGARPEGNLDTQRQMIRQKLQLELIADSIKELLLDGDQATKEKEFGIASAYYSRAVEHLGQCITIDPFVFGHVANKPALWFQISKHRALLGIESGQFHFALESARDALEIAKELFMLDPPEIPPPETDVRGRFKMGSFRQWQCACIMEEVKRNGYRIKAEDIGRCYYYQSIAEHVLHGDEAEEQAEDDKLLGLGCCVMAKAEGVPQELLALDKATMERLQEWETDEEDADE